MPNIKSAKKRVNVIKSKTLVNTIRKSDLKTSLKKCQQSIANKEENSKDLLKSTICAIDRAAKKNLIHNNKASRQKSQLTKAYNASFNS
ncbi:MAG: 30S ribosomal protein S20 [Clostridiales bacterium]